VSKGLLVYNEDEVRSSSVTSPPAYIALTMTKVIRLMTNVTDDATKVESVS
jgi:hypothetical protein